MVGRIGGGGGHLGGDDDRFRVRPCWKKGLLRVLMRRGRGRRWPRRELDLNIPNRR
jgi:hypothetical protein